MASFQAAIQIFHNKRHGLLSLLDNFAALSGSQLLPIGYIRPRSDYFGAGVAFPPEIWYDRENTAGGASFGCPPPLCAALCGAELLIRIFEGAPPCVLSTC